jgi:prepilin-type processing-associated H-X9-DG protein
VILLKDYVNDVSVFQCPTADNSPGGMTDYYYNPGLQGKTKGELAFPESTILSGDGVNSGTQYTRTTPETAGNPPADARHLDGANYLFTDGHVKWLKPDDVSPADVPVSGSNYSFDTGIDGNLTAKAANRAVEGAP